MSPAASVWRAVAFSLVRAAFRPLLVRVLVVLGVDCLPTNCESCHQMDPLQVIANP